MTRIKQGDIFKDISLVEDVIIDSNGDYEIQYIKLPYLIIMTQDCDIEQEDFEKEKFELNMEKFNNDEINKSPTISNDKSLFSLIVLPAYNFDHFYQGEHLSELGLNMGKFTKDKTPYNNIKNNENKRYYRFHIESENLNVVCDFKHYFTIKREKLESMIAKDRIGYIGDFERLDISNRFAGFLSRIGLPK